MVAPTAAAPSCQASRTVPKRTWSYLLGYVRSSLWLSLQMKGMRCAYLRATEPSTPNVDATALHPPSIVELAIEGGCNAVASTFGVLGSVASSTIFSPSTSLGLSAK